MIFKETERQLFGSISNFFHLQWFVLCTREMYQISCFSQMCAHVKHPKSICRKRVRPTAGGMKTRKHSTHGEGSAVTMATLLNLRGEKAAARISRALHFGDKIVKLILGCRDCRDVY